MPVKLLNEFNDNNEKATTRIYCLADRVLIDHNTILPTKQLVDHDADLHEDFTPIRNHGICDAVPDSTSTTTIQKI